MMRRRRRRRRIGILLVGGLVAYGVYKMSKKDAKRIEEHTGTSPEEMSDEELEKAMAELNIEKQYRDESDQEVPAAQGAAAQGSAAQGAGEEEPSYLDELERLSKLRDQGVITDEEFEAKKKQLLGL
jgi:predicted Zn-dependent peptidase